MPSFYTFLLLFCFGTFTESFAQTRAQKPSKIRDAGVLVIRLGNDTSAIHDYRIEGVDYCSKVLTFGGGLRFAEGCGKFHADGYVQSARSKVSLLDAKGEWLAASESELSTTSDSTIVASRREGKTNYRNFAGKAIVNNNGDAVTFQLFPFYALFAPRKTGDSVILKHVTGIGTRDFVVKRIAPRQVLVRSRFMGPITLYLDKKDRLLSVNALGSSLNFTATVYRDADFEKLKRHFAQKQTQNGTKLAVSIRDTAQYRQGEQQISVNYWRPFARGRKVFGGIVPLNRFWRVGANNATEISLSRPVQIDEKTLPAGKYTLFAQPTETTWTLCFNKKTSIWGTEYDPTADVLRVPMRIETLPGHVEQFTISIENDTLRMDWEKTRLSVSFQSN